MTIRGTFTLIFLCILGLFLLSFAILKTSVSHGRQIAELSMETSATARQLADTLGLLKAYEAMLAERGVALLSGAPGDLAKWRSQRQTMAEEMTARLEHLNQGSGVADWNVEAMGQVLRAMDERALDETAALIDADGVLAANLRLEARRLAEPLARALEQAAMEVEARRFALESDYMHDTQRLTPIFWSLSFLILTVSLGLFSYLLRWVSRPIDTFVSAVERMRDPGQIQGVALPRVGPREIRRLSTALSAYIQVRNQTEGELTRAQQAMAEAKAAADAANRSKSDFLANMSHEIRTPMNAIIGLSYLALQTELSQKQYNYIEKVQGSAKALLGIINDILDFSKIEAGRLTLERTDFRLEAVLDELANLVGLAAEQKEIELLFQVPLTVPTNLIGDPLRLAQILTNLGNNAVKFTGEGGEILVSVELRRELKKRVMLEFRVQDTGIGIEPVQQAKLFQIFSQVDSSITRQYGGTGLGLAIAKRLCNLMGGEIWVSSRLGQGSTFGFTAWFDRQPSTQTEWSHQTRLLGGSRVLVVDDNATARAILGQTLMEFGFRVALAEDGQGALDRVEEAEALGQPYALVLMDWNMPGMDGVAAIEGLQRRQSAAATPTPIPAVIMVTAFGKEEARQAAEHLPVTAFLAKPVTPSTLLDAVFLALGEPVRDQSPQERGWVQVQEYAASLRGARVLLVEDNAINQELVQELLTEQGLTVTLADNGEQALQRLATADFDAVLMDCQMPIMDGYTATRAIRAESRWRDLPIIAMTASAMVGDREKALAAGMSDHIAKPLDVERMWQTLAQWINSSQAVAATPISALAPSKEAQAPESLPELPGFDLDAGLAVAGGQVSLYQRLLRHFLAQTETFESDFRAAQGGQDATAPARCAHSLRGVAGNLGARDLQAAAQRLEHAAQGRPLDQTALEFALTEVAEHLATLRPAVLDWLAGRSAVPVPVQMETPDWSVALERLHDLLAADDSQALALVDELALPPSQLIAAERWAELTAAIQSYDFETALGLLAAVRSATR